MSKEIFEQHPELTHYFEVGDRTFLPSYEQEANDFARATGQKIKRINKPKGKK